MRTSGYAEDELRGVPDGLPRRRIAAAQLVEEVVEVGEGGDGLHPPFERAQDQQLHPLDRLRLEHVPRVHGLAEQCGGQYKIFTPTKWAPQASS